MRTKVKSAEHKTKPQDTKRELAIFGSVHLQVTDIGRAMKFWRDVIGLELRRSGDPMELGTEQETLVTLHSGANHPVMRGYSGLYHLAVHLPNEPEFARVLARLIALRWPISPTDHIMSKAIYLTDPDGITVEITLETPERFGSYLEEDGSFMVIDAEGRQRGGTEPLNVNEVLAALPDDNITKPVPAGTKIGHLHFYVGSLDDAYDFYGKLGFTENQRMPAIRMGDMGAGGRFTHRIAFNTWQGEGAPQAPAGTAGMRYAVVRLESTERLQAALKHFPQAQKQADGYLVQDPSGNAIMLTVGSALG